MAREENVPRSPSERAGINKVTGNVNAKKAKISTSAVRTDGATVVENDVAEKTGIMVDVSSNPKPRGILKESDGS